MIWPDVPIFIRDYSNGIKKLDDNSEEILKKKIKYNPNAFHLNPLSDDFGLDEKYTIRPFNIHTSSSLKDLFKNKTTPSRTLGGTVNLSTGTKEILKMTEKMIPKIDHSKIDSGYYENKMNKIHSNEDLMLREMSKADAFAKGFIDNLKPVTLVGGGPINLEPSPAPTSTPAPTPTPSKSTSLNMTEDERTHRNKQMLSGLKINSVYTDDNIENIDQALQKEQEDETKHRNTHERTQKFHRIAGHNYGKNKAEIIKKAAGEMRDRRYNKIEERKAEIIEDKKELREMNFNKAASKIQSKFR